MPKSCEFPTCSPRELISLRLQGQSGKYSALSNRKHHQQNEQNENVIDDCLPSAVHPSSFKPLPVGQGDFVPHLCIQHCVSSTAASKALES